jgi:signal transduction histidine kinase
MNIVQIGFVSGLALATVLSFILTIVFFRNRLQIDTKYFSVFFLAGTIWAAGYLGEIFMPNFHLKFLMVKFEYFGIAFVPAMMLCSMAFFITDGKMPTKKQFILVHIVPVITVLLIATNDYHNIMYKNPRVYTYDGISYIGKEMGIWYAVHVVYSYGMLLLGAIMTFMFLMRSHQVFRLHTLVLFISVILPWTGNIVFVLGGARTLDFTPVCFIFSGILILWAMLEYQLFDVFPAARTQVFESMQDCVLVLDVGDRIVDMSTSAKNQFGNSLIGCDIHGAGVVLPEPLSGLLLKSEGRYESYIGGKTFDASVSILRTEDLIPFGKIISMRDITRRKNAQLELQGKQDVLKKSQQELVKLNASKDKFFSIIAHDLKSPFSSMIGLTQIIIEEYDTTSRDEIYQWLSDLKTLSINTLKLVENLLQWSRVQTGAISFHPGRHDVGKTAEGVCALLEQTAKLKNIQIICSIPENTILEYDEDMIETVFRNLIANAVKYSFPGSNIVVSHEEREKEFCFMVTDKGKGISPDVKERLFRIEKAASERGTSGEAGTGLGLIICKEFVGKHGGEITVDSIVGEGTTFSFTIPKEISGAIRIEEGSAQS